MESLEIDSQGRRCPEKIRNIYDALRRDSDIEIIENLLERGDVNCEILTDSGTIPNLLFTSFSMKPNVVKLLLNYGADFTKKTDKGRTIVHEIIQSDLKDGSLLRIQGIFKNELLDAFLTAHVKFNNKSNPCNDNGLSHFHVACITNNTAVLEFFLNNGVDVNHAVNADSTIFPLDTPLHLAAKFAATESVEILLKYGANTRLKNARGWTPMHVLVEICQFRLDELSVYERTLDVLFGFELGVADNVESIDDFGFCLLHVACVLQKESAVESILEKIENVDQFVDFQSPVCSGYTALHFSASSKIEIFQLLLDRGSNITAENAKGETPLDMFLQKHDALKMHRVLLSKEEWQNIILSDEKTKLIDVVLAMENIHEFVQFLDLKRIPITIYVPFDSPLLPGYTLLHLAVAFAERTLYNPRMDPRRVYDNSITHECLKRGAVFTLADAKGSTALHLAFNMRKRHLVKFLLDRHKEWKNPNKENPTDKDILSHFHIACAIRHLTAVEYFLSYSVDVNSRVLSSFWSHVRYSSIVGYPYRYFTVCPGSTALHISIASGDHTITALLLKHGADVHAKDANGFTPVHRLLTTTATQFNKEFADSAGLLSAENLENSVAEGGLSHLHVACCFGHTEAIEKLLDSGADVNAAVTYRGRCKKRYYEEMFDPYGDVDDPLNFLCDYAGYTPLHFAMLNDEFFNEINLLLIKRGADIFKKAADGTSFLTYLSNHSQRDLNVKYVLNSSSIVREHFEKEFGWTKLHFACCSVSVELVKKCINHGINAKILSDSPVWKGYTPLHIVTLLASLNRDDTNDVDQMKKIAKLLIENGADPTLVDDHRDTPFHLYPLSNTVPFLNFLFEHLKNYTVNPTNLQGDSIFHLACATHNVAAIQKFLEHDADVNQPASYFSRVRPGGTPLHLTIRNYHPSKNFSTTPDIIFQIIEKLVQHGADVNAVDVLGESPLFGVVASKSLRQILMPMLIRAGTDLHLTNFKGTTAFDLLLVQRDAAWDEIELFLEAGCHFNTFNPKTKEGRIASVFRYRQWTDKWTDNEILLKIIHHPLMIEISKEGRTAIHNIVSDQNILRNPYVGVIEQLIIQGCDIDHQDNEGKTPLHLAVHFNKAMATIGLLKNGADVNITDKSGKTFIANVDDRNDLANRWHIEFRYILEAFAMHVYKLEFCGLYVNKQNKQLQIEALEKYPYKAYELTIFHEEVEKTSSITIGDISLSLHQFLIDRHMDVVYMNLTEEEKQEFDQFFSNIGKHKFVEVESLLKLIYRQTIQRIKLIEPALESLNILTRNQLPDLCCRYILKFLINEDLKHLTAAGS